MHRLKNLLHRYDTAIWIRVFGMILTTLAGWMVRPFLALYLYNKLDGDLIMTALIVGLQPATGLVAGLISGGISDRYGRKPVMVIALLIECGTMLGYIWANSVLVFAILTILNGVGNTLFQPAAQAQVADVVPEERRSEVFALLHTSLNLGVACAPLLGVMLYKISPKIGFIIASTALFLFCLVVLWKIKETLPDAVRQQAIQSKHLPRAKQSKLRFREHKILFGLVMASLPFTLLYSQVESILPQQLKTNFPDYLTTYATILTINGTMVVAFQLLIAKWADRIPIQRVVFVAFLFVACTAFGYGWSRSFVPLVMSEIFFTVGEMLNGPQIQKAIALIAPEELRGRYFAIFGSNWAISGMIGPVLGALFLRYVGGAWWFSLIGTLLLCASFVQFKLVKQGLAAAHVTPSSPPHVTQESAVI